MRDQQRTHRSYSPLLGLRLLSRRFKRNESGATAVEFAMVLAPFLAFTFGIITVGLHYLATNSLEKAVHDASRQIRTGQAQQASMTAQEFKAEVCRRSAPHIDCTKLQVHMASYDSWTAVTPPNCVDNTSTLTQGVGGTDPITNNVGGASKKVLVTACYNWPVAKYLPHWLFGNSNASKLQDGGLLMQTSAVFQTEPYE